MLDEHGQGEEQQTTPDLSHLMEDARPIYAGSNDPADQNGEPAIHDGDPGPATDIQGAAPITASDDTVTPDREKKEDAPPDTGTRFRSHEEAERGYKELQGRTTRAEQRAAALEHELHEINEAKELARQEEEAKNVRGGIIEYSTSRRAEALAAIDQLDPDMDDYRIQAASIMAQADVDIFQHIQRVGSAEPRKTESVTTSPTPDPSRDQALSDVHASLDLAGIEHSDPLFWSFARTAPDVNNAGMPLTLAEQTNWAITETKNYHQRIQRENHPAAGAVARARTYQEQIVPLGRGGAAYSPATSGGNAQEALKGLNATVDEILETRRL